MKPNFLQEPRWFNQLSKIEKSDIIFWAPLFINITGLSPLLLLDTQTKRQGPVSRKSRKLFAPEMPFVKLRPVYPVTLVFSYVVKGIKITVKFRASRRLRFEDTKKIMSPEMGPKSFGTFEKQAPPWNPFTRISSKIRLKRNAYKPTMGRTWKRLYKAS